MKILQNHLVYCTLLFMLMASQTFSQFKTDLMKDQRVDNWMEVIDQVNKIAYAENPIENLEGLSKSVTDDGKQYLENPNQKIWEVILFIRGMDEDQKYRYQLEKNFRNRAVMDTVFVLKDLDVSGDGKSNKLSGQVYIKEKLVHIRITTIINGNNHIVIDQAEPLYKVWSPVDEYYSSFYLKVNQVKHLTTKTGVESIVPNMTQTLLQESLGVSEKEATLITSGYMQEFRGQVLFYGGIGMIWYQPSGKFVPIWSS